MAWSLGHVHQILNIIRTILVIVTLFLLLKFEFLSDGSFDGLILPVEAVAVVVRLNEDIVAYQVLEGSIPSEELSELG